jgi:hypothetical protein
MRRLTAMAAAILIAALPVAGCSRPKGPNVTPVGQTAAGASDVMKTANTALLGLEIAADQVPELRPTVRTVAKHLETVGKTGKSLAHVLEVYRQNRTPAAWSDVVSTIGLIRATLNAAIDEVPEGSRRDRIRGILQPIFDAVLLVIEGLRAPTAALELERLELLSQLDRGLMLATAAD